ncbi:reverse transcriptase domain-containing protein [Peribacillus psychrosaccharolyticus]|uniref:reverse transcriptase domain-containing protein n=1 Tax=Peribacillus psychrosaccharolyticus TaxID=1407 RepID=UPI003D290AD6
MRKLGIPTVVDRVVQQAIHQVLSPIFEKQFSEYSYGFRPKRSCEMAIIKSLEFLNNEFNREIYRREIRSYSQRREE